MMPEGYCVACVVGDHNNCILKFRPKASCMCGCTEEI